MRSILIFFVLFLSFFDSSAQIDSLRTKFILDLPVADAPANFDHRGLAFRQFSPSMSQSLAISKSFAEAQQYYTQRLFFKPNKKHTLGGKVIRYTGLFFSDVFIELILQSTPFGTGWAHEEWHRAVMNKNNVRSFNDMNKFPIGKSTVSVSHVLDEDLAKFKLNNNADFVRMNVAGIEAQYEYVKAVQKDNFFYNRNLFSPVSLWLNIQNSVEYVRICSTSEGDQETIKMEEEEGSDIKVRDFTGLDMVAWIYDLSRPNEPYADRGINPSGIGIRRYRRTTDLTNVELDYLKKMGKMQALNYISPTIFFINEIKINSQLKVNFAVFHYLTSFGYDVGNNFFLNYKGQKVFLALHNYHNLSNSFWGLELQMLDKHTVVLNKNVLISPTIHLWSQPKDLLFRTSESELGGKTELRIASNFAKIWQPYLVISAKTRGWVAGDVYQGSNVSGRLGVRALIR